MVYALQAILYFILFCFGACIFSFLNVVIYRVPKNLSFVKGYSACPACGHRLHGRDMVPILSWLFLRGKCRYCGEAVSARYSVVEALGGAAMVASFLCFDTTQARLTVFAFLCMLAVVSFVDLDTMEIPDRFHVVILLIAVLSVWTMPGTSLRSRLIGAVCVSVPMLVIDLIIPGGFGGGDIKLMAVCGFYLGWKLSLLSFLLGVLAGGVYGMALLAARKKGRKEHFAFGPFLCVGMTVGLFAGTELIHWYMGFFSGF